MSHTAKRIIVALLLVALVFALLYMGRIPSLIVIYLLGLGVVQEICSNMLGLSKKNLSLWTSLASYSGLFVLYLKNPVVELPMLVACVHVLFFFFVFFNKPLNAILFQKTPWAVGGVIFLQFCSLIFLVFQPNWVVLILALLCLNYGVDAGGWIVGKHFGKRKLAPNISPNKTIEGLVGGVFLGSGLCYIVLKYSGESLDFMWIVPFLCVVSQVGDLVQSLVKRYFDVKDSSSLIPGHGGVYDRVDSLIFTAPFFVWAWRTF